MHRASTGTRLALSTLVLGAALLLRPGLAAGETFYIRVYTQSKNMTPTVENIRVTLVGQDGQSDKSFRLSPTHATAGGGGLKPYDMKNPSIFFTKDNWYEWKLSGMPSDFQVLKLGLSTARNDNAGASEVIAVEKVTIWREPEGAPDHKWRFWKGTRCKLKRGAGAKVFKVDNYDELMARYHKPSSPDSPSSPVARPSLPGPIHHEP